MAKDKVTTGFKRQIMHIHCFSHPDCENCVLCVGGWDKPVPCGDRDKACPVIEEATPRDIDRAYELITAEMREEE